MGQVSSPKTLFLRDSWVQIPPPALTFISLYLLDAAIKLFMIIEVCGTIIVVTVAAMPTRNRITDNTFV
jgi:hypothetical protein